MKFGMGMNTERTQKYAKVKVQNDIRTSTHIYKQTNITKNITKKILNNVDSILLLLFQFKQLRGAVTMALNPLYQIYVI